MRYATRIRIDYRFAAPTGEGRQLLRLIPQEIAGVQRVIRAAVSVAPEAADVAEFTDFFGNRVTEVALPGGHKVVRYTAEAEVERLAPLTARGAVALARLGEEIAAVRGLGPSVPHHFRGPSPRIPAVAAITEFARGAMAGVGTALDAVVAFGEAIHGEMTFDAEATTVETSAEEAFVRRIGVCQDFAQIMIAGLRGAGVPAAYVSGLIRTVPPKGQARLEGADAMHAWVAAWCGRDCGWVEYDPTNACVVGADHVVIARGRDYGDVAPVAGILRMAGAQTSGHAVDVVPLDA
jgi:transglutaminase-like putative cysteine protease